MLPMPVLVANVVEKLRSHHSPSMKNFLAITVLTAAIVLSADAEEFNWNGTRYDSAMVVATDQEKKTATIEADPFNAPAKVIEVPLRNVPQSMLNDFANPVCAATSKHIYLILFKATRKSHVSPILIYGKIVRRLGDNSLIVDCHHTQIQPAYGEPMGTVRLNLLQTTNLAEGDLVMAATETDGQFDYDDGGVSKKLAAYRQLGPLNGH
jgi:hypothetical protein